MVITPADLLNILRVIYFIHCSTVLSVQSKALPGKAWLWAQLPASAQKSVCATALPAMLGDDGCLLCVKWSMGAKKTVRVSAFQSTGEYQQRRRGKNPEDPTGWPYSLYSPYSTVPHAWTHTNSCTSIQNPSPVAWEYACWWGCAWKLGTGYSLPLGS